MKIKGCRHLPKTDTFGKCDPYCVVLIGSDERKTNRKDKTYDPDFDEELDFKVKRPQTLSVSVWDWDRGKSDELVGTVDIPIGKLKPETKEISIPLLTPEKGAHLVGHDGQETILLLSLTPIIPEDIDEDATSHARDLMIGGAGGSRKDIKPWKLEIDGLEVHHLPKTDTFGKCDPYIMLAHSGDRVQTKPVKKVYDATWADTFDFAVVDADESLNVTIMDWDMGMQDDLVGNLSIDIKDLTPEGGPVTKTLPVTKDGIPVKGKDGKPCELTLKMVNKGLIEDLADTVADPEDDPMKDKKGFLTVTVVNANGLPKMDTISQKADPFVKLTVDGQERKTNTHWRTLEPEFNESFEFEVVVGRSNLIVEVRVWLSWPAWVVGHLTWLVCGCGRCSTTSAWARAGRWARSRCRCSRRLRSSSAGWRASLEAGRRTHAAATSSSTPPSVSCRNRVTQKIATCQSQNPVWTAPSSRSPSRPSTTCEYDISGSYVSSGKS